MIIDVKIKINDHLYLRDPEQSELGRKIVKTGLIMINQLGFEEFTFKKLAKEINTTETGIYRYFENKHRLLTYLSSWYWSFLVVKIQYHTNNIKDPKLKIVKVIDILAKPEESKHDSDYILEKEASKVLMWEGSKAYLTRQVLEDNKEMHFKPLKDLCATIAAIFLEYRPKYKFPHSLASTLIETAYSQKFYMLNLPSLTNYKDKKDLNGLQSYLESIVFGSLK